MIAASSSGRYPYRRATSTSSRALATTGLRSGAIPVTDTPRPRRNSTSPSSRNVRNARNTVLGVTPQRGGRARGGGEPLPGARLAFGDRPADGRGDLLVQRNRAGVIDLHRTLSAMHISIIQIGTLVAHPRHAGSGRRR